MMTITKPEDVIDATASIPNRIAITAKADVVVVCSPIFWSAASAG